MEKIYIIDAVNFLFRSYFAIGPMTNSSGESTNALFGFIRSINKLIKDFAPTHLIAVFDGPDNKQSRKEIYGEYKAHRTQMPPDLFSQLERAVQYCELASIPLLMVPGVEADDTMGSIAKWAEKKGSTIFLCSSDKDLCQLVSDHVFVVNAHKDNLLIDKDKVKELFGVFPEQMVDYLAMVGDASDNIPGLEGFGPKTAADLLSKWGNLDTILENADSVSGKKQEILKRDKEIALLSRRLATIHVEVPFSQDETFFKIGQPDYENLKLFFQDMNFLSLLREMEPPPTTQKKVHYSLIDSHSEFEDLMEKLTKEKEISIAIASTDTRPMYAKVLGISFSIQAHQAWYIPLNGSLSRETILSRLKLLFENPHIGFCGHDTKHTMHLLLNEGIALKSIAFDTLIASHLLAPHHQKHQLRELALMLLDIGMVPFESLVGKGKNLLKVEDVPLDRLCNYYCEESDIIGRFTALFKNEIQKAELSSILYEIELPLISVLLSMERRGIYVDVEQLKAMSADLTAKIQLLENEIYSVAKQKFNINSPKQLGHILFDCLGIKPLKKTTTGYSTAADVLETLSKENPFIKTILNYRTLEKLRSTYVDALQTQVFEPTHRIHCTLNQTVTATGRLSCQDPNLQNIPIRTEEGRKIRTAFMPEKPHWSYLAADYSQIELRLLAHFSEDPSLIKAFQAGEDIHAFTASLVFNIPLKEVTPRMRHQAKAVNFGILYGQQAFGLSQGLDIEYSEAAEFIETYFQRYKKVKDFFEFCKENARKTGRATTLSGRKRPIPDIHSKNPLIRSQAERFAMNTPLQGTAADLIKMAMMQIHSILVQEKDLGFLILQIHDELLFEVPNDKIPKLLPIVKEKMENVFSLKVPLIVDISIGKNWGEC